MVDGLGLRLSGSSPVHSASFLTLFSMIREVTGSPIEATGLRPGACREGCGRQHLPVGEAGLGRDLDRLDDVSVDDVVRAGDLEVGPGPRAVRAGLLGDLGPRLRAADLVRTVS